MLENTYRRNGSLALYRILHLDLDLSIAPVLMVRRTRCLRKYGLPHFINRRRWTVWFFGSEDPSQFAPGQLNLEVSRSPLRVMPDGNGVCLGNISSLERHGETYGKIHVSYFCPVLNWLLCPLTKESLGDSLLILTLYATIHIDSH